MKLSVLKNSHKGNSMSFIKKLETHIEIELIDSIFNFDEKNILVITGMMNFQNQVKCFSNKEILFLKKLLLKNVKIIGICSGLHIFFESSEESKNVKGLSLIKGKVKKINNDSNTKVPMVGPIKTYFKNNKYNILYYSHSYFCNPKDSKTIMAYYKIKNIKIPAYIKYKNFHGLQFHPEFSKSGINFLKNIIYS